MSSPIIFPIEGGRGHFSNDWGAPRGDIAGGKHLGNDIFAPKGTPVVAVTDGVVSKIGFQSVGGNRLWINGTFYYAHLDHYAPGIKKGVKVKAGQVIGFVGNTGDARGTPYHLHFGYSPDGSQGARWSNPYTLLRAAKAGVAPSSPASPAASDAQPPAAASQPSNPAVAESFRVPQLGPQVFDPGTVQADGFTAQQIAQSWQQIAAQPFASADSQTWLQNSQLAAGGGQ